MYGLLKCPHTELCSSGGLRRPHNCQQYTSDLEHFVPSTCAFSMFVQQHSRNISLYGRLTLDECGVLAAAEGRVCRPPLPQGASVPPIAGLSVVWLNSFIMRKNNKFELFICIF
ncbi:hypothetical protein E2C01_039633 [Portunus trituberculatus]|uniref:Uncharacterized protein n=1 Tax=Portunus trituberculatus TaxID=210409 RepID=A0A5B7FKA7_PORTR|nr:hypothetical protein [Portunus trituberculatus]